MNTIVANIRNNCRIRVDISSTRCGKVSPPVWNNYSKYPKTFLWVSVSENDYSKFYVKYLNQPCYTLYVKYEKTFRPSHYKRVDVGQITQAKDHHNIHRNGTNIKAKNRIRCLHTISIYLNPKTYGNTHFFPDWYIYSRKGIGYCESFW